MQRVSEHAVHELFQFPSPDLPLHAVVVETGRVACTAGGCERLILLATGHVQTTADQVVQLQRDIN